VEEKKQPFKGKKKWLPGGRVGDGITGKVSTKRRKERKKV